MTATRGGAATTAWPAQPVIYEIHAWVWLAELAADLGRPVDLASVPPDAWDEAVPPGVDAVWLMGVWERSPRGVVAALQHPGVAAEHRATLPDLTDDDVVGSPYCVRSYTVDPHLGGDEGLAVARRELGQRGARLLLDYVPNHVALDHPWLDRHPELFIQGTEQEAIDNPREFVRSGRHVVALGRDPHFEPWEDLAQLNAFSGDVRRRTAQVLSSIAQRADGVRCDMAMLMVNEVFARTWGERAGVVPAAEFWPDIIGQVRRGAPGFLFVAEVYWDMEATLLEQGFDYCYDKVLHDRLVAGDVPGLRVHLGADDHTQRRLVRFAENHDEPRAAAALPPELWRSAAVLTVTLPGAVLLYEGQLEGRAVRPPVALGRRPAEPHDPALRAFYLRLLTLAKAATFRHGSWALHDVHGWADNGSHEYVLAWSWTLDHERYLIVVNLSLEPAQARVTLPWPELRGRTGVLVDALQGERYERDGDTLRREGLYVGLPAGGIHLLAVTTEPPAPAR